MHIGADGIKAFAAEYPDIDPADLVVASGMSCDEVSPSLSHDAVNADKISKVPIRY